MRKIVSLAKSKEESYYEASVFSKFPDTTFVCTTADTEEAVVEATRDAEVILFTATALNKKVISQLEKCKLMVRYGIGYDTVDLDAARERGIYVCNSPKYGVVDVAEHAIALIFATAKHLIAMSDNIRDGIWGPGGTQNVRLTGKTIGFLGFGNIGQAVCHRTNAFGMKPVVYDPYVTDDVLKSYKAVRATLDEVLGCADVISCHLPLNDSTYHMLGAKEFDQMKPSAILVNTSRGGVINEKELLNALEDGKLFGVGLDVFEDENGGMDQRMFAVKNAVLTPHVAWNTAEAVVSLHKEVADNVARYLRGERPESIVNGL